MNHCVRADLNLSLDCDYCHEIHGHMYKLDYVQLSVVSFIKKPGLPRRPVKDG